MTIKETAGRLLLYFYELHRTVPADLRFKQLHFIDEKDGSVSFSVASDFEKNIKKLSTSGNDIFNGLRFLIDKQLIETEKQPVMGAEVYVGIRLTDLGIDMVEGIERGQDEKRRFNVTFNINVENNMNVESLVKANLSMLGLGL